MLTIVFSLSLAIKLLNKAPSGAFLIRDSNSFQGAYGLAVKVAPNDGKLYLSTHDIQDEHE